jgi:hypothetical protein
MSKKDNLLQVFLQNVGLWVCGYCNSGSNQPAATFREIKKLGYKFEEYSPNRWGKDLVCENCKVRRTHYKLISSKPEFDEKKRLSITSNDRERILKLLDGKDAFTNGSISSTPEIDHKIPWTRLEKDIDVKNLSDKDILLHFQLLTREHNLLKDRACGYCKVNAIRPPLFGICFWYDGNETYQGSCYGCGWFDGVEWREKLNAFLKKIY